jgi:hypothetical protein
MLNTSNFIGIAVLFLAFGNATSTDASAAEDQSPKSKAIEAAQLLIEVIETEYDCEVAIKSIGPLFDSDRVQFMFLVECRGSECDDALSTLDDRGRAHSISFVDLELFPPKQDPNPTPQEPNHDLIYQIDPDDAAK